MSSGTRTLRAAIVLTLAGLLQMGFAQKEAAPKTGLVPAGTIIIHCPTAACSATVSGVTGTVRLPPSSGTVLPDIPGGAHDVTVTTAGTSHRARVQICGDSVTVTATRSGIETSAAHCPPFGYLSLSAPKGADINVAGSPLPARGSQRVAIYVGTVSFAVALKGYQTYTDTVDIKASAETDVTARLQPQPGIASIGRIQGVKHLSVDGVDVIRHGELQSTSLKVVREGPDLQVRLAPGKHVVKATKPNYAPLDASFDLKGGAHASWNLRFEPLPARVTLKVWPPNAHVSLDGTTVDTSQPKVVSAGAHEITASASGFEPLTKSFTAEPNGNQELDLTLVGNPVSLVFRGVPVGATVRVDGGKPVSAVKPVTVRPGPHTFQVHAPGYATLAKKAVINTTPVQWIDAALEKLGHIAIAVSPASSSVSIDGATVPVTAGRAEEAVKAGTHAIEARARDYAPKSATVDVGAGKKAQVTLTLTPVPATAKLVGLPDGASATLDGHPAKIKGDTISIADPGKHTLVVGSAAVVAKSFSVTTAPGGKVTVDLGHFDVEPATITLHPVPPGTRILVDGQAVEKYSGPFELAPGKHTIWLAAPGYKRVRLSLTVTAGQKATIDPGLQPAGN